MIEEEEKQETRKHVAYDGVANKRRSAVAHYHANSFTGCVPFVAPVAFVADMADVVEAAIAALMLIESTVVLIESDEATW